MNLKKTIMPLAAVILTCFLCTLLLLAIISTNESIWFSNIFLDKVYVFELVPLYLIGAANLDRQMTIPAIVRIGRRSKALFISLFRKWGFAFAYLCIWFILVNLITSIKFTYIYEKGAADLIDSFFRYLAGLIMISIISEIFGRSHNKYLADNSYLCANLLLALEVIALVPEIRANTRFKPSFVFSWIFNDTIGGYVAITTIIGISMLYLLRVSIQEDILC